MLSRDDIFHHLRGIDYDGIDRSIDGRISKLRRRLEDSATEPTRIKTVWGKGYLLVPDAWGETRVKNVLHEHNRRLLFRSYLFLVGGLLVVAVVLDLGFGYLQYRRNRTPIVGSSRRCS